MNEEGVYLRKQPFVWGCVCACTRGAERLEFVQMGPSSMGAKPGDEAGV